MSAQTIGNYCQDFLINVPNATSTPMYYRRTDSTTGSVFYLTVDKSTGNLADIKSPINNSTAGYTKDDFLLTLAWVATIKPVVDTSSRITPSNVLRFVKSNRKDANANMIVKLMDSGDVTIGWSTGGSPLSFSDNSRAATKDYVSTNIPPDTVENGPGLVYFVNENDSNDQAVTKSTMKRYITGDLQRNLMLVDLFTPGITETIVKRSMFRINRRTSLDDNAAISYSFEVFVSSTPPVTLSSPSVEIQITSDNYTIGNDMSRPNNFGFKYVYEGENYIPTTVVIDKTIADLFGDSTVTLFKYIPPPTTGGLVTSGPTTTSATITSTSTNLYMGYENKILVIKDYFLFTSPIASCQFNMYNLGGDEFMLRISGTIIRLKTDGAIEYALGIPTIDERGWIMEDAGGGGKVRLLWKSSSRYLQITPTSTAPSVTTSTTAATIFECIKCTYIDSITGACETSRDATSIERDVLEPVVDLDNIIIRDTANLRMKVTNAGVVTFVPEDQSNDKFFITKSGTANFIGKKIAYGSYIYAKYTPLLTDQFKFVYTLNPSIEDGFGWNIADNSSAGGAFSRIVTVANVSPQVLFMNKASLKFVTTIENFSVSVGDYIPNSNKYTINTDPGDAQISWRSGSSSGTTKEIPASASTGPTSYIITYNRSETDLTVPPPPALSVTRNPTTEVYATSIKFKDLIVNGMNDDGTVEISLTGLVKGTFTYKKMVDEGVTISDLTELTAYTPSFKVTNTLTTKLINFTLPQVTTTRTPVKITAPLTKMVHRYSGSTGNTNLISGNPAPLRNAPTTTSKMNNSNEPGFVFEGNSPIVEFDIVKPTTTPVTGLSYVFVVQPNIVDNSLRQLMGNKNTNWREGDVHINMSDGYIKFGFKPSDISGSGIDVPTNSRVLTQGQTVILVFVFDLANKSILMRATGPNGLIDETVRTNLQFTKTAPGKIYDYSTTMQMMNWTGAGDRPVVGLLGECMFYNSILNQTEIADIEATMKEKYLTVKPINAVYMNEGAENKKFRLRVGNQYVKLNINNNNVDDPNNRFWETTNQSDAAQFTVDTTRKYGNGFRGIKLATYGNTPYTGSLVYLRHYSGWIYKRAYDANNALDFAWKFEDVPNSSEMRIVNPYNSENTGILFAPDADGIKRLKNVTLSNTTDHHFTVELI
jgi:hypothetical protein